MEQVEHKLFITGLFDSFTSLGGENNFNKAQLSSVFMVFSTFIETDFLLRSFGIEATIAV